MPRPKVLIATALLLALLAVGAAVTVPGALAERDDPVRPADLHHLDATVRAGDVTGETVTLHVENRLRHRGGPARNVTVLVRAIDAESGMLASSARTDLGTLAASREYNATTAISVPREGGYELEAIVYVDGTRRSETRLRVSGVGTLIPDYATSEVEFRFSPGLRTDIPPILYSIQRVRDGRATLEVTPWLTNTGDEQSGALELVVLARQSDSNVVADRATVQVGRIQPGGTAQPSLELTVPDGYNYRLDAMLRRDGVVVAATSVPASLDPTETVPVNATTREVGLETSDFEEQRPPEPEPRPEATPGQSGPGFGVAAALVALLSIAALARRFRQ